MSKDDKVFMKGKDEVKAWMEVEKPRDFDPFGQAGFAHLWLQYD